MLSLRLCLNYRSERLGYVCPEVDRTWDKVVLTRKGHPWSGKTRGQSVPNRQAAVGKDCKNQSDQLLLFTAEASSYARTAQHTLDTQSTMTPHSLSDPRQAKSRWRHSLIRAPFGRACGPCDSRVGTRFWFWQEFNQHMQNEAMVAYMASIGLEVHEVELFFHMVAGAFPVARTPVHPACCIVLVSGLGYHLRCGLWISIQICVFPRW